MKDEATEKVRSELEGELAGRKAVDFAEGIVKSYLAPLHTAVVETEYGDLKMLNYTGGPVSSGSQVVYGKTPTGQWVLIGSPSAGASTFSGNRICIAVIDETSPSQAVVDGDWAAFRAAWPARRFHLLVPNTTAADVKIPAGWPDALSFGPTLVLRDNGAAPANEFVGVDIGCLEVQADGRVLVGGSFVGARGVTVNRIVRLETDGTLDPTWDISGTPGVNNVVHAIKEQPNGKILVGGQFTTARGTTVNGIIRLNNDGTLDPSWDLSGTPGVSGTVRTIALQPDGKIVIGGTFLTARGTTVNNIVRLNSDGTIDPAWNLTGTPGASASVRSIGIQNSGKIVIGGDFVSARGTVVNSIVSLNSDGTIDPAWDLTGTPGVSGSVRSIAIQPDGKIVASGSFFSARGTVVNRVIRLNTTGTLDGAWDLSGTVGANNVVYDAKLQSDGKIIIGGAFTAVRGVTRRYCARLNSDGTLDTTFNASAGSTGQAGYPTTGGNGIALSGSSAYIVNRFGPTPIKLETDGSIAGDFYYAVTSYSDWYALCNLSIVAQGNKIGLFIDESGSMTLTTVANSYFMFQKALAANKLFPINVFDGNERYILPFIAMDE